MSTETQAPAHHHWIARRLIPMMKDPESIERTLEWGLQVIEDQLATGSRLSVLDLALESYCADVPKHLRSLGGLLARWAELEDGIEKQIKNEPAFYLPSTVKRLQRDMEFMMSAITMADVLKRPPPDSTFAHPRWMVDIALDIAFQSRLEFDCIPAHASVEALERFGVGISNRYSLAADA